VASAGMRRATERFAAARGLAIAPSPETFITHYVRKADFVPSQRGGNVFGRDVRVASIYHCTWGPRPGPHPGPPVYSWGADFLTVHSTPLYHAFFDEPGGRHIWYSKGADSFTAHDGEVPSWRTRTQRPANF